MDESWYARIMALEKEVAELKEAVRAVQERDGKPLEIRLDTGTLAAAISKEVYDGAMRRIQSRHEAEQLQTTSQENETQD